MAELSWQALAHDIPLRRLRAIPSVAALEDVLRHFLGRLQRVVEALHLAKGLPRGRVPNMGSSVPLSINSGRGAIRQATSDNSAQRARLGTICDPRVSPRTKVCS
jgi:hypothetical protein